MRLPNLAFEMNVDAGSELNWVFNFAKALNDNDYEKTIQVNYPGIISFYFNTIVFYSAGIFDSNKLAQYPYIKEYTSANLYYANYDIKQILFFAKLSNVIIASLLFGLAFILLNKLIGNYIISFISILLCSISPLIIHYSRTVKQDSYMVGFILISFLCLLIFLKYNNINYLYLSGIFAGFGALTKAILIIVYGAGVLGVLLYAYYSKFGEVKYLRFKHFLIIPGITILIFFIFYPGMWVAPFDAIKETLSGIFVYGVNYDKPILFIGELIPQNEIPGLWYYSVYLFLKMNIISLLLFVASLCVYCYSIINNKFSGNDKIYSYMLIMIGIYFGIMSFGSIKNLVYLMPIIPFMIIFSVAYLYKHWPKKKLNFLYYILIVFCCFSLTMVICYYPHYERYTNPLMGKHLNIATQYGDMPAVGLMEAANYLNNKSDINNLIIAAWYPQIFYLECKGQVTSLNYFMVSDYVVFYRNQVDRNYFLDIYNFYAINLKPEYIVKVNNVEYVWIYHNNKEVKEYFQQITEENR